MDNLLSQQGVGYCFFSLGIKYTGRVRLEIKKTFFTKGWWGQAPQGSGHDTELPEFSEYLDNILCHMV